MSVRFIGRRGLVSGVAALLGVGLANLAGGKRAEATHGVGTGGPANSDGQALHVDYANSTTNGTGLSTDADSHSALTVFNGSPAFGVAQGDALQATTRKNGGYAAGVHGRNHAATGQSIGVLGLTKSTDGTGVYGGSGYSQSASIPAGAAGVGVYGTGVHGVRGQASTGTGVHGQSTDGLGVYGLSKNSFGVYGATSRAGGGGVFGYGAVAGSAGLYGTAVPGGSAAVFDGPVFVNGSFTVTPRNAKSAAVAHPDGSVRRMYCQEAPEPWFEDFGTAALASGQASVALDPDFDAVVKGDDYRVFLTEIGDCGGLYISRKGPHRFEVRSRAGASASGSFDYRVVARRRDDVGRRMEKVDLPKATPADLDRLLRPATTATPPATPPERER